MEGMTLAYQGYYSIYWYYYIPQKAGEPDQIPTILTGIEQVQTAKKSFTFR